MMIPPKLALELFFGWGIGVAMAMALGPFFVVAQTVAVFGWADLRKRPWRTLLSIPFLVASVAGIVVASNRYWHPAEHFKDFEPRMSFWFGFLYGLVWLVFVHFKLVRSGKIFFSDNFWKNYGRRK